MHLWEIFLVCTKKAILVIHSITEMEYVHMICRTTQGDKEKTNPKDVEAKSRSCSRLTSAMSLFGREGLSPL